MLKLCPNDVCSGKVAKVPLLWIIKKKKTFMQCVTQLIKLLAKVNENILQSFKSENAPWPFRKWKAASSGGRICRLQTSSSLVYFS